MGAFPGLISIAKGGVEEKPSNLALCKPEVKIDSVNTMMDMILLQFRIIS